MNNVGKIALMVLAVAILIGSIIWLKVEGGTEPVVGILTAVSGIIFLIIDANSGGSGNANPSNIKMKQRGGRNSKNYQSGGNMTINP